MVTKSFKSVGLKGVQVIYPAGAPKCLAPTLLFGMCGGSLESTTLHLLELCALLQIMLNRATHEESLHNFALVCLCFVYDLFSEAVSYTMYSIERYVD